MVCWQPVYSHFARLRLPHPRVASTTTVSIVASAIALTTRPFTSTSTPKLHRMSYNKQRTWIESEPLVLKKSKFKGYCIPITSKDEVEPLLEQLMDLDKALKKASHPRMYAWKIGRPSTLPSNDNAANSKRSKNELLLFLGKLVVADQSTNDNGEGGAGQRLEGLLARTKLVNILVVVARWYGGTPLGPARFRCISDVAAESLQKAGLLRGNGVGGKLGNGQDGFIDAAQIIDSGNGGGGSGSKR